MTVIDTSSLINSLTGDRKSLSALVRLIERSELIVMPTIVLHEWLRGPRLPSEISAQEALFPAQRIVPFGADEARVSADLYRSLKRPRGREVDILIAACAIVLGAELWTGNKSDFADLPGLRLSNA